MTSNETLEANVAAIRVDLNELKTDFSIAIARIDNQIKVAVSELKAEIGVMAEKAASTVERVAGVERQFTEMRAEDKSLRDKVDENYRTLNDKIDETRTTLSDRIEETRTTLSDKIDETRKTLTDKIDENHKTVTAKMDENHKALSAEFRTLDGKMTKIASDRAALSLLIGGLVVLITLAVNVGNALHLFDRWATHVDERDQRNPIPGTTQERQSTGGDGATK